MPGWTTSTLPSRLMPLRIVALAHVNRERPRDDDEDLLLHVVNVAPPLGARQVAEGGSPASWPSRPRARDVPRIALAPPRLPSSSSSGKTV